MRYLAGLGSPRAREEVDDVSREWALASCHGLLWQPNGVLLALGGPPKFPPLEVGHLGAARVPAKGLRTARFPFKDFISEFSNFMLSQIQPRTCPG